MDDMKEKLGVWGLEKLIPIFEGSESEIADATGWLRMHCSPEARILQLWNETAKSRLSYIHFDQPTVDNIIKTWPRYADKNGYVLVDQDFENMHTGKGNRLMTKWPEIANKVIPHMGRSKDKEAKKLHNAMCSTNDQGTRQACSLALLPSVLTESSVATLSKTGKRSTFWKPSVAESMSNFVDIQRPGLDLQQHLLDKEATLKAMSLSLQPHVVVICDDEEKIDSVGGSVCYAVVQSNLFYEMPSVMAAIDTCIKVCFVMNLSFSVAARSSWLFLQRSIFDINTPFDAAGSKVLQLLADVNKA